MIRKPIGITAPYRQDDDDIQEYKKPWVGLTDEERQEIALEIPINSICITEAILKERNT